MNKVGRRLPPRDTPPEPGTDCLAAVCLAAVALPQVRFPIASTTATIVTRLLQPPPGDGVKKGHLAIELYLTANCLNFHSSIACLIFPVFWQAAKLPCPSNGKPWSIHRSARAAQSADETDDGSLAREDARHIVRWRISLFRRYWELFAPYLTPDLAGNAVEPGCPHERPRSLAGRPCAPCGRGQLAPRPG